MLISAVDRHVDLPIKVCGGGDWILFISSGLIHRSLARPTNFDQSTTDNKTILNSEDPGN